MKTHREVKQLLYNTRPHFSPELRQKTLERILAAADRTRSWQAESEALRHIVPLNNIRPGGSIAVAALLLLSCALVGVYCRSSAGKKASFGPVHPLQEHSVELYATAGTTYLNQQEYDLSSRQETASEDRTGVERLSSHATSLANRLLTDEGAPLRAKAALADGSPESTTTIGNGTHTTSEVNSDSSLPVARCETIKELRLSTKAILADFEGRILEALQKLILREFDVRALTLKTHEFVAGESTSDKKIPRKCSDIFRLCMVIHPDTEMADSVAEIQRDIFQTEITENHAIVKIVHGRDRTDWLNQRHSRSNAETAREYCTLEYGFSDNCCSRFLPGQLAEPASASWNAFSSSLEGTFTFATNEDSDGSARTLAEPIDWIRGTPSVSKDYVYSVNHVLPVWDSVADSNLYLDLNSVRLTGVLKRGVRIKLSGRSTFVILDMASHTDPNLAQSNGSVTSRLTEANTP